MAWTVGGEIPLHMLSLSRRTTEVCCQGASGLTVAVKYTIRLTPVKDLCWLVICERGVFDVLSAQQPEVELPHFPLLPTDLQANTHPSHSMYSFSLTAL